MDNKIISNGALLKAFGQMKLVKTSSGPVEPATAQVLKVCKDKILKPLKKDQTKEDFDSRRYTLNARFESTNKFITTRDLYQKVVLEAANRTPYRGMRLDLSSIDVAETHCKFIVDRRGNRYIVELFFPNANEAITVSIADESENRKLYEVSLESEQYTVNFGYTILKSIDEMAAEYGNASIDDMLSGTMVGNLGSAMRTAEDTYLQPSALLTESVDWQLHRLKGICEAAAEEQAPGAEAFSADINVDDANQQAIDAGNQMENMAPIDGMGEEEQTIRYTDFAHSSEGGVDINKDGHIDHMTTILNEIQSKTPQYIPANGKIQGLDTQQPDSVINAFGVAYNFIHTNDDPMVQKAAKHGVKIQSEADHPAEYDEKNLITNPEVRDNEDCFPENIWRAIFDALGPNFTTKMAFDQALSEILPKVFDATGNRVGSLGIQNGLETPSEAEGNLNAGTPAEDPYGADQFGADPYGDMNLGGNDYLSM